MTVSFLVQLAVAQHFYAVAGFADDAFFQHGDDTYGIAIFKSVQAAHVHFGIMLGEHVVEAPLRQASCQSGLAAFKARAHAAAASGPLALVAAARCFAVAAANAAALAPSGPVGAQRGGEFMQFHWATSYSQVSTESRYPMRAIFPCV